MISAPVAEAAGGGDGLVGVVGVESAGRTGLGGVDLTAGETGSDGLTASPVAQPASSVPATNRGMICFIGISFGEVVWNHRGWTFDWQQR